MQSQNRPVSDASRLFNNLELSIAGHAKIWLAGQVGALAPPVPKVPLPPVALRPPVAALLLPRRPPEPEVDELLSGAHAIEAKARPMYIQSLVRQVRFIVGLSAKYTVLSLAHTRPNFNRVGQHAGRLRSSIAIATLYDHLELVPRIS